VSARLSEYTRGNYSVRNEKTLLFRNLIQYHENACQIGGLTWKSRVQEERCGRGREFGQTSHTGPARKRTTTRSACEKKKGLTNKQLTKKKNFVSLPPHTNPRKTRIRERSARRRAKTEFDRFTSGVTK